MQIDVIGCNWCVFGKRRFLTALSSAFRRGKKKKLVDTFHTMLNRVFGRLKVRQPVGLVVP